MLILPPAPWTALAVISLFSEGDAKINRALILILPPLPSELVEIVLPRRRVNKFAAFREIFPPFPSSESVVIVLWLSRVMLFD